MKKLMAKQQGFTLVELLVALTIFAVGLLGIAGMQVTSITVNNSSTQRTEAVALGQSRMESLLARSPSDPIFLGAATTTEETVNSPGQGIYIVTSVVTPASPTGDLATIRVQVQNAAGTKVLSSFNDFKRLK